MSEMNCKKNLETTHRHGSFKNNIKFLFVR